MSMSFNNPLIIGDNNKAIKEDIAQLQQDVGDLSQLDTADKSSLVNAINDAIDSTLNGASRDLDNLSDVGNDKLRSLNAYANEGELLTDPDGLAFVEKYAHSTYVGDQPSDASPLDPKKFVKVGSPTITDDRIYTSNLALNTFTNGFALPVKWGDLKGRSWNIKFRAYGDGTNTNSNPFGYQIYNSNDKFRVEWSNLYWYFNVGDSSSHKDNCFARRSFPSTAGMYDAILSFNIDTKTYSYKLINVETGEVYVSSTYTATETTSPELYLINQAPNTYITWRSFAPNTRMDFKQFSIKVDGVEVFSGNKTGIDTIKPSNFTAITSSASSPFVNPSLPFSDNGLVITEDGIASGFSASNYLTINPNLDFHNFVIEGIVTIDSLPTDYTLTAFQFQNVSEGNYRNRLVWYHDSKKLAFSVLLTDNTSDTTTLSVVAEETGTYQFKISFNGVKYQYQVISPNGIITNKELTNSSLLKVYSSSMRVGRGFVNEAGQYWEHGSIDLNALKIYVDGDLVYQPCLKIPYTLSKTGAKIVDSIYRDRVNDMAEQFGYANYYTLDEDNGNFTLPQTDIYGLIEKVSNRPDYDSVITVSDINGSSKAYTIGAKCLAIIKPSTPAATYTISIQPAYGSAYKSISGYGYMTLEFDTGDKVYASVASSMDIYLIR